MAADGKVVFEITANDAPLKKSISEIEKFLKQQNLDVEVSAKIDRGDVQKSANEAISAIADTAKAAPVEVPIEPNPTPEWDGVGESVSPDPVKVPIEPNKEPAEAEMPKIKSWFQRQAEDIKSTLKTAFAFSLGAMIADAAKSMGGAIADFAKEGIGLASDLEEVQNVVDVTFGQDSKTIDRWAKNASRQFGLTELQAKRYTSTLGAMMKSSGLTGDAITDMSVDMAGLAADMASFYNIDFDEAFQKIQSGLSGETEPLRQLGINMSVANLEAFALAEGITKSYESMTQAEQVTLRYQYLMAATADAQGDFARTSDSLANSQRMLTTELDTLKANLGESLLPVVGSAVSAVNSLFDAFTPEEDLTETFEDIEDTYVQTLEDISAKELDANALVDMLADLEAQTVLTDEDQRLWNATLDKLVETMPELSGVINTTTGEIEGGIPALRDYVAQWAEMSKQQAYITAYNEKLKEFNSLQVEAANAQVQYNLDYSRWENASKEAEAYLAEIERLIDAEELDVWSGIDMYERYEEMQAEAETLRATAEASGEAVNAMNEQLAYGQEELQAYAETMQEASAATQENLDINSGYGQSTEEMVASLGAVEEALQPLIDYQMEVRDATLEQVNGVISGFEKLETGTETTIQNMIAGLQSQTEYMNTYAANMQEASRLGIDEGLLASLSDGSVQSAAYLAAIVTGSSEEIDALNAEWLRTQEGKDSFVDVLTAQQLAADTQYQAIYDKAHETILGLDMETEAKQSLSDTVQGIIDGIDSKAEEVQESVNRINAIIGKMGNVSSYSGKKTSSSPSRSRFSKAMSFATGLDYVPYDEFPAYLHRGEAVLTAEEANLWRAISGLDAQGASSPSDSSASIAAAVWAQAPEQSISIVLDTGELVGAISTRQGLDLQSYDMSKWGP